ncbi:hypothetical protein FRB94_003563 [Tulasnella sp. JGI-2019a]|nr:hypothetical protein FRB93_002607 [Tulasnella sp. JGI-2019a]KAG9013123.1 hypothetical protein FRB94_003563 [Tulasnella sp. JGI-2019a]KAG9025692.1 hypothetical protein FRB95_009909 [Tulasnella sp. JGI-2019a]
MQNPREEIAGVVHGLTTTSSPVEQLRTLEKYFVSDAAFDHPLCRVDRSPESRDMVADIYQWYKILSPSIELRVKNVVFDEQAKLLFLDCVQTFHVFVSPMEPTPAHFVVKLELRLDSDGLYRIIKQTDFYQPEDLANLTLGPFVSSIIGFLKHVATQFCYVGAFSFQTVFCWWNPVRRPLVPWAHVEWFRTRSPVGMAKVA